MNSLPKLIKILMSGIILLACSSSYAITAEEASLLVWANEAIITTYTLSAKTYLEDEKNIATYFTSAGWLAYNKALNASKLPEAIQKNSYDVSAVAIAPAELTTLDQAHWSVVIPILVQYKNLEYQQQQQLKVTLGITRATAGQGVRGYAITSLQSVVIQPLCQCPIPTPPQK